MISDSLTVLGEEADSLAESELYPGFHYAHFSAPHVVCARISASIWVKPKGLPGSIVNSSSS